VLRCLIYFKRSFCRPLTGNEREGPFSAGIVSRRRRAPAPPFTHASLTRHRHHSHQPARTCARAALSSPARMCVNCNACVCGVCGA